MAKLTAKRKRFAEEYRTDWNATQAAIRAGYSPKTAKSTGQRLLTFVDVQNYIQELAEAEKAKTDITVERIVAELGTTAFLPHTDRLLITGIVKTADKNKALELLGKHLGMFTDKLQLTGPLQVVFEGEDDLAD